MCIFNYLSVSDIIQLLSVLTAILISIVTLIQTAKITKEANMAQIEVFPFKINGDYIPRIRIQNFGKAIGTITDVTISEEIPTENIIVNPFDFYKGLSLASGQSFTTIFSKLNSSDVPLEEFDVDITYKTLNKTIKSTCHINYKFLEGAFDSKAESRDAISALDKINQSIQGLQ